MTRVDMKRIARETLREHRAKAILGLIFPAVAIWVIMLILVLLTFATLGLGAILYFALMIALIPLPVGIFYFYRRLLLEGDKTTYNDLLKGHKDNFLRNIGRLIQMQIFVFLWMLLLYVPGIVKGLAYFMTPYILGDDDIKKGPTEPNPITVSRMMMDGHKFELFVMFLSFIGWLILGVLTFHILTIVFVMPYMQLTFAQFYETRKGELEQKRLASPQ